MAKTYFETGMMLVEAKAASHGRRTTQEESEIVAQAKGKKKTCKAQAQASVMCLKQAVNGEIPAEDSPIMIYYKWCKGCGICVAFCPKKVLDFDETEQKPLVARPQDCIQCGLCELRCPDFAITRVRKNPRNGNHEQDNSEEKD